MLHKTSLALLACLAVLSTAQEATARTDVVVGTSGGAYAHWNRAGVNYVVQTNAGGMYVVYVDENQDVAFKKSADNGNTWGSATVIFTGTTVQLSVWYDRWSGIAAGLIHCAYTESGGSDTLYRSIDTESSDALSTQTTIFAGTSVDVGGQLTIARMRGGNLLSKVTIDNGVEGGVFRSVDAGANWTSRTNDQFGAAHQSVLLPGWAADNQDAMLFYWANTDEISRKLYDDSANTWGTTSIATSMPDYDQSSAFPTMAGAVDIANSRNVLVAWSGVDTANADLRCWHITESAITEVTNVVLNSTDDQGLAGIAVDTATSGHWIAFYGGKSDGSETFRTAINIYYKETTNSGTTWGSETVLTVAAKSIPWLVPTPRYTTEYGVAFFSDLATDEIGFSAAPAPAAGGLLLRRRRN